jgi:predicted CopG family antitoxin
MSDKTTIQVSKQVRDELAALGAKTDSFDSIIRRLLEGKGADR